MYVYSVYDMYRVSYLSLRTLYPRICEGGGGGYVAYSVAFLSIEPDTAAIGGCALSGRTISRNTSQSSEQECDLIIMRKEILLLKIVICKKKNLHFHGGLHNSKICKQNANSDCSSNVCKREGTDFLWTDLKPCRRGETFDTFLESLRMPVQRSNCQVWGFKCLHICKDTSKQVWIWALEYI